MCVESVRAGVATRLSLLQLELKQQKFLYIRTAALPCISVRQYLPYYTNRRYLVHGNRYSLYYILCVGIEGFYFVQLNVQSECGSILTETRNVFLCNLISNLFYENAMMCEINILRKSVNHFASTFNPAAMFIVYYIL